MPLITKEYKFCAAHQYWNNNWSKEENLDVFGKDVKNHGHNYILRVTVSGKINHNSGFLVDLKWLNTIIEDKFIPNAISKLSEILQNKTTFNMYFFLSPWLITNKFCGPMATIKLIPITNP